MRLVLTTVLLIASGTADASSITSVSGKPEQAPSVVKQQCSDCARSGPKAVRSTYHVPTLEPGTQRTEIVEIDGEKKLVRTEAWLGGSPVTFVSKVPSWVKDTAATADVHPSPDATDTAVQSVSAPPEGIDSHATTGALSSAQEPEMAQAPAALPLATFELRPTKGL